MFFSRMWNSEWEVEEGWVNMTLKGTIAEMERCKGKKTGEWGAEYDQSTLFVCMKTSQ